MEQKKLDRQALEQIIQQEAGLNPNPNTVGEGMDMNINALNRVNEQQRGR